MSALIRATNLWGYDAWVRSHHGNPLPLLQKHGLLPAEERNDHDFVSYANFTALLEETAWVMGKPDIGLRLAEYQGMGILGPISVIARSATTVSEAMSSIARYLHLHSPALSIHVEPLPRSSPPLQRFEFKINTSNNGGYSAQAFELSLANTMQVMKLLCGDDFQPNAVYFRHAQMAPTTTYREIFGCEAHFNSSWCGFHWRAAYLDISLASADHNTWLLAERYLSSQQAPGSPSLAEDVARLIHSLLPTGHCHSEAIAQHLAMHKRTLQRRLSEEGTSFDQLLLDTRKRLAKHYLAEPKFSLTQITGLLGYSEQSVFSRACNAWFGMTPRKFRQHLQQH